MSREAKYTLENSLTLSPTEGGIKGGEDNSVLDLREQKNGSSGHDFFPLKAPKENRECKIPEGCFLKSATLRLVSPNRPVTEGPFAPPLSRQPHF